MPQVVTKTFIVGGKIIVNRNEPSTEKKCRWASANSVGYIKCGCCGKTLIRKCENPQINDLCIEHAAPKPYNSMVKEDGKEQKIEKIKNICSMCDFYEEEICQK